MSNTMTPAEEQVWVDNLPEQAEQAKQELEQSLPQPKPHTGTYTPEEEAELIAYWNDHATVREIANQMNRSFNNVRNKVAQLQKKGIIRARDAKSKLPDQFVEMTAGVYQLPIDTVAHFITLFSGSADKVIAQVNRACQAYVEQGGWCYYLRDKIKLTMDGSPSGVVVSEVDGNMVLICRAVAGMRMSMSHNAFVGVCKHIALFN